MSKKLQTFSLIITLFFSVLVWSAEVTKVSGKKVLIKLDGFNLTVGTNYYLLSSDGKKKAIIEIKQVKNNLALGELKKGQAQIGYSVQATQSGQTKSTTTTSEESTTQNDSSSSVSKSKSDWAGGVLLGLSMNTFNMTVQSTTNTTLKADAAMKGTTFGLRGFVDYAYSKDITLRGFLGYEPFTAKANVLDQSSQALCDDGASEECTVSFTYLSMGAQAQYNLINGKSKLYIGAGYNFMLAMGKSVNVPNLDTSSSANQMITFLAGYDLSLGNGFIPLVFEYGFFPGSSSVNASSMILRGGYGFSF